MKGRLVILFLVCAASISAATPFRTPRLEKMAQILHLSLPDELAVDAETDSMAIVNGKDIYLRTNAFGDVSHIGYRLFANVLKESFSDSPVFDFVERYLLEIDLGDEDMSALERLDVDHVQFVSGTCDILREITPETDLSFSLDVLARKKYRITMKFDAKEVCLVFPANNQLLTGTNLIDLENMLQRDMQRVIAVTSDDVIEDWSEVTVSHADSLLYVEGETHISPMIRSNLYLTETNGHRKILIDSKSPSRSVSNIVLTGLFDKLIPLHMVIDRYGGNDESIDITLQQFVAYCKLEGCKMFFGIKSLTDDTLTGTLFAYNEQLSYDHMLSIVFPLSILKGEDGNILGKLYSYIPLNDVPDKFFNNKDDIN